MPKGSASIEIGAPCEVVFDVLHDYPLRLSWDTMLSEARLLDAPSAAEGVRSLCVGNWRTGYLPMETEYVTFRRGEVAAVRLTNRPPVFERFAASIRHTPLAAGRSRVTYTYSFRCRPRRLALVLEPVVERMLAREVRARLAALRDFVERRTSSSGDSSSH
jgi:hypothetical protein